MSDTSNLGPGKEKATTADIMFYGVPIGFGIAYGLFGRGFIMHWAVEALALSLLWGGGCVLFKGRGYRAYATYLQERGQRVSVTAFVLLQSVSTAVTVYLIALSIGFVVTPSRTRNHASGKDFEHFKRSLLAIQKAHQASNRNGPGTVSPQELQQWVALHEEALAEAKGVDDAFLDKTHPELRQNYRTHFQQGIALMLDGMRRRDQETSIRGQTLMDTWGDWMIKNQRDLAFK